MTIKTITWLITVAIAAPAIPKPKPNPPQHSYDVLKTWRYLIGKNLAFIDMGGPCNKAGFSDLSTFCPFTNYYIASDLPNGGYDLDDWSIEKFLLLIISRLQKKVVSSLQKQMVFTLLHQMTNSYLMPCLAYGV